MLFTVVPAAVGTAAGYVFARMQLDPEEFRRLAGMYAAAGAAAGILGLRVVTLFWTILSDYFQKND
jgi:hypothetical protein